MSEQEAGVKPGHGDHWLAALPEDDPRIQDALAVPVDAPDRLTLHRAPLTQALDRVQVTHKRRLVSAYPEPRATILAEVVPRELLLWETRVEGWLVMEHPAVGALTAFVTDLAERADRYAAHARGAMRLELSALAYRIERAPPRTDGTLARMWPARTDDARFLPDDYAFDGDVVAIHEAAGERVLDVELQNGFALPITSREAIGLEAGDRVRGYLWLTARWPES